MTGLESQTSRRLEYQSLAALSPSHFANIGASATAFASVHFVSPERWEVLSFSAKEVTRHEMRKIYKALSPCSGLVLYLWL